MARYAVHGGGERVLDPACGAAALLAAAGDGGAGELWGVDTDEDALSAARQVLGPAAHLRHHDFLELEPTDLGGAFDAVVVNPPFLRQESIAAPRKEALRRLYPRELSGAGGGRLDLLGFFLLRLTRFLRPGGRLAFLSSAAWLTSRYGRVLRTFLAREYELDQVLESVAEPWFDEARTRGVLVLARRAGPTRDGRGTASFVRATEPLGDALLPPGRSVPREHLRSGEPWGALLRTPAVLGRLQADFPDAFTPLGQLVEARFGLKSGADKFFLYRDGRDGFGRRWPGPADALRPIVYSPMDLDRIDVDPAALPRRVLVLAPDADRDPRVARHIRETLEQAPDLPGRPTCRARERGDGSSRWFTIHPPVPAPLLWTRTVQYRHLVVANPHGALVNNNLIGLWPRDGVGTEALLASLNSAWTHLERYARGRVSNEGKIKTEVGDLSTLRVLTPHRLDGVSLDGLRGRKMGRIADEMEDPRRREFELQLLLAAGIELDVARALVEELARVVRQMEDRERAWETRFKEQRRRSRQETKG